jgi:hypothetical protein
MLRLTWNSPNYLHLLSSWAIGACFYAQLLLAEMGFLELFWPGWPGTVIFLIYASQELGLQM